MARRKKGRGRIAARKSPLPDDDERKLLRQALDHLYEVRRQLTRLFTAWQCSHGEDRATSDVGRQEAEDEEVTTKRIYEQAVLGLRGVQRALELAAEARGAYPFLLEFFNLIPSSLDDLRDELGKVIAWSIDPATATPKKLRNAERRATFAFAKCSHGLGVVEIDVVRRLGEDRDEVTAER